MASLLPDVDGNPEHKHDRAEENRLRATSVEHKYGEEERDQLDWPETRHWATGFKDPTKFVGPVYSEAESKSLAAEKGWTMKKDGDKWRRVVPSPLPKRIFEIRPMKWLLEKGTVVIAAGGGGIPTVYQPGRVLSGIEAVIDKDLCSELLARELKADGFIMATDADAVFLDWGKPTAKAFRRASPKAMREFSFPAGSMGPKVEAACHFAEATGKIAAIGALKDLPSMLSGTAGTTIATAASGVEWAS